ncbi:DUF4845 domain-containing protein [Kangiella sediminilitoris]|uniref:DUF4845 domain-containing protein n=1 Tax=Kangiella sediminilitoris TaxID=1144748 RepID=A0A1B3BC78_9GAMM|nr:DUF4845 domain-containing protein [Kangiella sediminilitoris]AOE50398.1 hypothetical protein KS2013_1688 [Kangiella sediminilitoris]
MFGQEKLNKKIMNRQYQGGMTAAGWLIIMGIVLFFMYLAIKLVPAYMEFFSIKSSIESVALETSSSSSKSEIERLISGRFNINNIDIIKADDVDIKEITGGRALYVEYESRIALFGNVSALLEFKHEEPLN